MKPPKRGPMRLRHEWREWGKCVLACAIACVVMALLSFVVGTPERTEALWSAPDGWIPRLAIVTGIWFAAGPVWTLLSTPAEYERKQT